MKCNNCGYEFEEGMFCPECGTKWVDNQSDDKEKSLSHIVPNSKIDVSRVKRDNSQDKIPWYFSIWFIIIMYCLSLCFLCIPAMALNVLRLINIKKKRVAPGIILAGYLFVCGLFCYYIVNEVSESIKYEENLRNGNFDEALSYLESQSEGASTCKKYAEYYAALDRYDDAVQVLLDYYCKKDILEIEDSSWSLIDKYAANASDEIKNEVALLHKRHDDAVHEMQIEEKYSDVQDIDKDEKDYKKSTSDKNDEIEGNETINTDKIGHKAREGFDSNPRLVKAEQIYEDYGCFENIELIKHEVMEFTEEDKKLYGDYDLLDQIDAVLSHYDESGLVSIEMEVNMNYFVNDDSHKLVFTEIENVKFDMTKLEGKNLEIQEDYGGNVASLLGIDYFDDFSGVLSFHDLDRVDAKIIENDFDLNYSLYSEKPVVKIEADVDGKHYEGDFCLSYQLDGFPQARSEYIYIFDSDSWRLDLYLLSDISGELQSFDIDLETIK